MIPHRCVVNQDLRLCDRIDHNPFVLCLHINPHITFNSKLNKNKYYLYYNIFIMANFLPYLSPETVIVINSCYNVAIAFIVSFNFIFKYLQMTFSKLLQSSFTGITGLWNEYYIKLGMSKFIWDIKIWWGRVWSRFTQINIDKSVSIYLGW